MTNLLLIGIISVLIYIAFFTPERRRQREIKQIQKVFNTPLYPDAVEFLESDERNISHPDEVVKIKFAYATRGEAMAKLNELREKFLEDFGEEFVQASLVSAVMFKD